MSKTISGEKEYLKRVAEEYETSKVPFKILRDHTALIVIDLQNEFVDPKGKIWIPSATRGISAVKKMIETCRELKVPVIYTIHTHHPYINEVGILFKVDPYKRLEEGTWGAEIYPEITPKPEEKVVRKHRYSAFYESDLDLALRSLGKDTVIISGVMTNLCCECTAHDALARDYKVVFGSDLNFTDHEEIHTNVLRTIRRKVGRVLSSDEIIKILKKGE